jgi:hypothetical protein
MRSKLDFNVGLHTAILHFPGSFRGEESETRRGDVAAVAADPPQVIAVKQISVWLKVGWRSNSGQSSCARHAKESRRTARAGAAFFIEMSPLQTLLGIVQQLVLKVASTT